VLEASGYFRLVSSLPGYVGERWLANHYFDTADRALRSRGAMLRIRETRDGRMVGLKQALAVHAGAFHAAEHEEPVSDHDWKRVVHAGGDLGILDHPVVREAFTLAESVVLPYLGRLRVLRKTFHVGRNSALELDLICFDDGGQDWELEVETEHPEGLRPVVEELLARRGIPLVEQTLTKYERFLAFRTRDRLPLTESPAGEEVMWDDGLVVRNAPLAGTRVLATRAFSPGERILAFEGATVADNLPPARGTRWMQVGPRTFLDITGTPGAHVNHSCLPSAGIGGTRELIAIRQILAGDEIAYDFAMTEYELELVCVCGTRACRGLVGGYGHLSSARKSGYGGLVSDYLEEASAWEEWGQTVSRPPLEDGGRADAQDWREDAVETIA
jgi:uncharacterized protein YjbK